MDKYSICVSHIQLNKANHGASWQKQEAIIANKFKVRGISEMEEQPVDLSEITTVKQHNMKIRLLD